MKNNHKGQLSKKACSSLALELEGCQNLHTTSNCERLRLLEKFAILVVQSVGSLIDIFLLQLVFSFIAATIFPLEKIRYTQQMNVAQWKKTVA